MTALEQMQELVRVGVEHGIKTVNVNHNDLKYLLVEVEQLRAKVTELQAVGSKLAYERQGIDKDRFSIAEKVLTACLRVVDQASVPAINAIDLAKVLGP